MSPPAHYRVTARGILGPDASAPEIWSMSISMTRGSQPYLVREDIPAFAQSLFTPTYAFIAGMCTDQVRLDAVRVASVDANGLVARDVNGAYIQGDSTGQAARPTGGNPVPFQTALVVTTKSLRDGANGRGRFYVPCPRFAVGVDGRISVADQTTVAGLAETWIQDLNGAAATTTTSKVVIASGGNASQAVPPALYDVTSIRVGRVLDTMRKRRNALEEEYISRDVTF